MKSPLLLSAALALFISQYAPAAEAQLGFGRAAHSQAMQIDPDRGVLTMAPLLEHVTPAVVAINTVVDAKPAQKREKSREEEMLERFFGDQFSGRQNPNQAPRQGLGSGVIVDAAKGLIITNNHVIDGADEINVTLSDKRKVQAKLIGTDPKTDIALLKIDVRNLSALKLAKSDEARVGDYVIAVGNPFGLSSTVTSGIISALGRDQRQGDNYSDYIQTDASINPGNSGGALVNSKGELIGINTAIVSRSGGNNGIGFAVPVRIVKNVITQLENNGEVRRGRIGVIIQDVTPDLGEALDLSSLDGALVSDVGEDTPAEKAGLKSGDVVVAFNDEDVLDSSDLRNLVGLLQPGTQATITYLRDGIRRTSRITIAEIETDKDPESDEAVKAEDMTTVEAFDGAEITDIPEDLELRGGSKGVRVALVKRSSKAYRAGLRTGDIIRKIGQEKIRDLDGFQKAIKDETPPYALSIERQGRNLFLAVK